MNDKKHIDRLFQEKLKDFEATPSKAVWENISSNLQIDTRDKKGTPLWLKLTGAAAGLILLITVGSLLINDKETPIDNNTVVDTETEPLNDSEDVNNTFIDIDQLNENNIVSEDELNLNEDLSDSNTLNSKESEVSNQNNNSNTKKRNPQVIQEIQANAIVENTAHDKMQNNADSKLENVLTDTKIADVKTEESENLKNVVTDYPAAIGNETVSDQNKVNTSKGDDLIKNEISEKENAVVDNESKTEANSEVKTETEEDKTSLLDELAETEKEEEDLENQHKRWSIAPHIAPVYYNTFGNGSSFGSQFNNNPKKGDINASYGITANYHFNDKLSIRTGISQTKLGYSTDNVVVYNNIDPFVDDTPLKNVRLNEYGQTLSFLSADGLDFAQVPAVVAENIKSSIDQQLGFIEVPVELQYKISDKNLGVSVIGGFSTLFLNQNEVYSSLQGQRTLLGEATNIKQTSFSANFGLGLDYEISEQFNLILEPVIKYQLNTFNDTSGNFNPYSIGIYTGFSFKF